MQPHFMCITVRVHYVRGCSDSMYLIGNAIDLGYLQDPS